MADKYWKGGGTNNNWNSSPVTNWANTDGGTGNQTAPSAGDRVFFTANSGTGAAVWNVSISLTMLDCTGSRNTITHNNGITITLSAGNFILPDGAGSTFSVGTGVLTFTGTSGTQQLKSNGKTIPNTSQTGVGGTVQLQDDCDGSANQGNGYTFSGGTLDLQTHNMTVSLFVSTGSGVRTLTGSGNITVNNTQASNNTINISATNLTISGYSGGIIASGAFAATSIHTLNFTGAALTWAGGLTVGANSSGGIYVLTGSPTFGALAITGPCVFAVTLSTTLTISGGGSAITINGTRGNEVFFASSSYSTAATLSVASGTVEMNWSAVRGMAFSGGATFSATNSFDLGYNTGMTITAPQLGVSRSRIQTGI